MIVHYRCLTELEHFTHDHAGIAQAFTGPTVRWLRCAMHSYELTREADRLPGGDTTCEDA